MRAGLDPSAALAHAAGMTQQARPIALFDMQASRR
jgi:hypothetical protein